MRNFITYFILVCLSLPALAQNTAKQLPNQFEIAVNGDTINRTNAQGKRSGIWSIYNESRFGDDSFYDIGEYTEDKKHGVWKMYSKSGLLIKAVNYYNNYKHGEAKFYDQGRLVCVGQNKALRTDVAYDTILVEDAITNELKERIIPTSLGSVRHGLWVYYKPPFKEITRIEEYQLDELIYEKDYTTKTDSMAIQKKLATYPHASGKLPPGIWRRKKGKAPVRFTDFPENAKFIKPNPGKKKKH